MSSSPQFVNTLNVGVIQILPADTTTQKTVFTAGAGGSKVVSVIVSSTDTSARVIQLSINRSSTDYIIASANVAAASGTDGVTSHIDLLAATLAPGVPTDNDGTHYLLLKSGDVLHVASTTTVTAAKIVSITAIGADF